MKKKILDHSRLVLIFSALLFSGVIALVCYYLFGAANLSVSSDTADTLLWAQASYESKSLINPNFDYATLLPLGGHLLMVPFISLFGLSLTAQSWGMLVFFLLFVISMVYCLRSFGWKYNSVFLASTFIILMTLVSVMTRTMFYQHILYYSQGLIYLFVGFGLYIRMIKAHEQTKIKKHWILLVLLSVWMLLTAINGEMTLAIFSVPLLGACILERIFQNTEPITKSTKDCYSWITITILCLSVAFGLVVRFFLCNGFHTSYADGITSFADQSQWHEHIGNLLRFWISITSGQLIQPKILSKAGIINVIQILAGFALVIVPIVALLRYRTLKEQWERLVVLVHWVTTSVIMFLFIFARYGEADWRLLPIVMTSILCTIVYLRHALLNATLPWKRIAELTTMLLVVNALWSGYFVAELPSDYKTSNAYGLISFLEENDLTDGYATYWYAVGSTVYSGERIRIRQISLDENRIVPQHYQSNREWYSKSLQKCFLLIAQQEANEFALAIPNDFTDVLYYGNDHIYIYDHNIIN